jgi:hypothetical protein
MSTRNILGGKGWPARKADNLTAVSEPIVQKMWEPQRLTALWASMACYRDSVHVAVMGTVICRVMPCFFSNMLMFRRNLQLQHIRNNLYSYLFTGQYAVTSQKTIILVVSAVRTSDLM